jgi:predicted XRE-type DNA-binding protein
MDRKAEKGNAMNAKEEVRQGSGNVFSDLRLPDAEGLNAKAQIAYRICQILEERKLTQKQAAALLGIDQPKVSALLHGRLDGFSSDRLFRFLNALDRDVEIVIKRTEEGTSGSIRILAGA